MEKQAFNGRRRRTGGTLGRSQGRGRIDAPCTHGGTDLMARGELFLGRMRCHERKLTYTVVPTLSFVDGFGV